MKNLQKGFSAVEVVLVLVFVLAIGGAGYYVINNQNDDAETTEQTTTQVEAAPIESVEDIDKELSEIDAVDIDSELDTSELDAELSAIE